MVNLVYGLTSEKPEDSDVVYRKLEVYINRVRLSSKLYDTNTEHFDPFVASHNDEVKVFLYDIDHVDNISEPAILEFIAKDTIPPGKPKNLQFSLLGQSIGYTNSSTTNINLIP